MEIISRNEALYNGLNHYFTNILCRNGHIEKRFTTSGACMGCIRKNTNAYFKKNPEKRREKEKKYFLKNPEKLKFRNKRKNKNRKIRNPDKERARRKIQKINRKARKRGNGGSHTLRDIKFLLNKQREKCSNCFIAFKKTGYHIDHVIALANGGSNNIYNIQLLCPACNCRKSAKDPFDFARENGRLL